MVGHWIQDAVDVDISGIAKDCDACWEWLLPGGGVASAAGFMLWTRFRTANSVLDGQGRFMGTDAWYHARMADVMTHNFPQRPTWDPWTTFPYGTGHHSGYGGLFNHLIALACRLSAGGDVPSDQDIRRVTAYAPAVAGAATALPVYGLGSSLLGRYRGLLPVAIIALLNGQFLTKSVVGFADHQAAEPLGAALAALGLLHPVATASAESSGRDLAISSVLGGAGVASYFMLWPQGVMMLPPLAVSLGLYLMGVHYDEGDTTPIATAGVGSLLVGAALTAAYSDGLTLDESEFSLIQPLTLAGTAAGVGGLWAASEVFERRGYPRQLYPFVGGGMALAALLAALRASQTVRDQLHQLYITVYDFGKHSRGVDVDELSSPTMNNAKEKFGGYLYLAALGYAVVAYRSVRGRRAPDILVTLWSLVLASAYASYHRFEPYFAIPVALLSGVSLSWLYDQLGDGLSPAHLVAGVTITSALHSGGSNERVWEIASDVGITEDPWEEALDWLRENTPEPPLDYHAIYDRPSDDDIDYPEGAYGVLSWWDKGHWITERGRRIPVANPFQDGSTPASEALLAPTEKRATLALDALSSGDDWDADLSNTELQTLIDEQSDQERGERVRYVMIDSWMVGKQLSSLAYHSSVDIDGYQSPQWFRIGEEGQHWAKIMGMNTRYYATMLARLYFHDGKDWSHYRLVHETDETAVFASVAQRRGESWRDVDINRELDKNYYETVRDRDDLYFYDVHQTSAVKTFERVKGARLTGEVGANETVTATLTLESNTEREFRYSNQTQADGDGEFELIVPYPTTDLVSEAEGGSTTDVTATGPYRVFVGNPATPTATTGVSISSRAVREGNTVKIPPTSPHNHDS